MARKPVMPNEEFMKKRLKGAEMPNEKFDSLREKVKVGKKPRITLEKMLEELAKRRPTLEEGLNELAKRRRKK